MRRTAVESLVKSFFLTGIPYSLVKAKLNLPTEKDAQGLVEALGYYQEVNQKTGRLIIRRIDDKETWV